jgi:hypothetical protein
MLRISLSESTFSVGHPKAKVKAMTPLNVEALAARGGDFEGM